MRLPYLRKAAPDVLATARAQRWEPAEVLRLLISEEVTGRDAATRRLRRHSANFPTGKTLGSWRAEDSTIPEPIQNSLITLEWIGRAENLVIAGPSGTGIHRRGMACTLKRRPLRQLAGPRFHPGPSVPVVPSPRCACR
ncbi:ATP-binding protein [Streptomyces sp. NPDC058739]|uniref:ATP-binding protein n=1 Tax=Streptomyces sp. NPDC058739 TaxID=3346618 RepID=UPI0036921FFE